MEKNDFGQTFLRLALEIDKHIKGYVDAYYGPEEIKNEIITQDPVIPEQLKEEHERLLELLPENDPQRCKYLKAQLGAMGFMIRKLKGEEFSYPEEVEGLFGIRPERVPEKVFLEAHKVLDKHIPGKGSLVERSAQRVRELKIPKEKIPLASDIILNKIRSKTDEVLSLVPGESVEVSYVRDKPWNAYNYYLGEFRSKIEINLDNDRTLVQHVNLLCHEAYPGHHLELQKKEQLLYQDKGYLEESCLITFTPGRIISEGIADTGMEIISPELDIFEWITSELMPILELPPATAQELYDIRKAKLLLLNSRSNAALLYHTDELNQKEVLEYLHTYMLVDEKEAELAFRRIDDPFWKTYLFTYTEGYRLIEHAARGRSKLPLFKRLITEQCLPDDLI